MKPRLLATTGCVLLALAGCQTAPPPAGGPASGPAPSQPSPGQAGVPAQSQPAGAPYKAEEIEAMVAPIALYPDALLAQVLMASTYPLEVAQAARWLKARPDLKGDAAIKAVQGEPWDVSVKSLVAFPQVLEPMNDKLDWTQKLGDAFLGQPKDVLDAVQRLRKRAQESGNLQSNSQQKVIVEPPTTSGTTGTTGTTIVRIEPADPQVIYVPTYDPAVVYGGWPYPGYPYYYWPPYPAYYPPYGGAIGFGVGLIAAAAIFGDCDWNNGGAHVEHHKAKNIDRNFDARRAEGGRWQHDAKHRQGVAYRDNASREKFGRSMAGADGRNGYRGRDAAGGRDNGFQGVGGGGNAVQRDVNRGNTSLRSGGSRGGGGYGGGGRGGFGGGRGGGGRR
ncbi:DUF3300 domain-containing protein [Cupriavidus sp. BIS7]|uniref:DUF3300 domain-containing protein n=1 Tax=Cupriavidus sp. BIS7 TaxID=1217718 RepID=UPI0002F90088|nr:DUF3300 domain-containing protein [Cupriavidus sp. BIS7]